MYNMTTGLLLFPSTLESLPPKNCIYSSFVLPGSAVSLSYFFLERWFIPPLLLFLLKILFLSFLLSDSNPLSFIPGHFLQVVYQPLILLQPCPLPPADVQLQLIIPCCLILPAIQGRCFFPLFPFFHVPLAMASITFPLLSFLLSDRLDRRSLVLHPFCPFVFPPTCLFVFRFFSFIWLNGLMTFFLLHYSD